VKAAVQQLRDNRRSISFPASSYRKHVYSYQWESWNRRQMALYEHFSAHCEA
jgi:hypothetical protein